ncbi:hypothetical protein B0T22DRAFT_448250 [Podospora appendiculata]|uniref:Uncharacterized protein n=1 Tax=Podospora appendiculata TaxID=314037 RepID=A0AAE1CFP5_9PEZI|nr:hypothetical protein B0T22DRAFT_448250 [Podospora appendiculata]
MRRYNLALLAGEWSALYTLLYTYTASERVQTKTLGKRMRPSRIREIAHGRLVKNRDCSCAFSRDRAEDSEVSRVS